MSPRWLVGLATPGLALLAVQPWHLGYRVGGDSEAGAGFPITGRVLGQLAPADDTPPCALRDEVMQFFCVFTPVGHVEPGGARLLPLLGLLIAPVAAVRDAKPGDTAAGLRDRVCCVPAYVAGYDDGVLIPHLLRLLVDLLPPGAGLVGQGLERFLVEVCGINLGHDVQKRVV